MKERAAELKAEARRAVLRTRLRPMRRRFRRRSLKCRSRTGPRLSVCTPS